MKRFWKQLGKAVCYVLFYFGMQVVVMFAATILISIFYMMKNIDALMPGNAMDQTALIMEVYNQAMAAANEITAISGVLSIVLLALFFLIRKKSIFKEFNVKKVNAGGYIWPALLGFCLTFAVSAVLSLLPTAWLSDYEASASLLTDTSLLVMFLANVIVAPIAEEVLFRGLVFTRLRKAMPTWVAILVTSLSFAVLHGQIVWIAYAFVLGAILTSLAAKYDSIIPGIVMHMVFNFFGSFVGYMNLPDFVINGLVILGLLGVIPAMIMAFKPEKKDQVVYQGYAEQQMSEQQMSEQQMPEQQMPEQQMPDQEL